MGKRSKGPRKKQRTPIVRRDLDAKRARRADRDSEPEDVAGGEADAAGAEGDEDGDDEAAEGDDEAADGDEAPESIEELEAKTGATSAEGPAAAAEAALAAVDDEAVEYLAGGARWAAPLVRLERVWTKLETRLLFVALLALTFCLCLWITMRGMKEPVEADIPAGTFFRMIAGAAILGGIARLATRKRLDEQKRTWITVGAVVLGLATAKLWRGVGIDYFARLNDWLQQGSTVSLFGGVLGISTRLTILVALIGASLAASSGQHINIDVFLRMMPKRFHRSTSIASGVAAASICVMVGWAMFDHLALTELGASDEATATQKVSVAGGKLGEMFFVWRKQVVLDLGALPYVVRGEKWNAPERMTGREWNEELETGGFVERYGREKIDALKAPEAQLDQPWTPFVVVPDTETRGILKNGVDLLMWPLGLGFIALRFLLRALLTAGGFLAGGPQGEAERAKKEGEHAAAAEEPS
jgi:tripartite ATP-independent transporter DctQ subunit